MKKVNSQQIEYLYKFTRQHYVEYYDVQTELVDHLANAIEAHWQTFPNDDFETTLQKEFRKFGVCGFSDVVEQKTKQMRKRYNRILWQHVKTFFSPPKLLITLLLFILIFKALSFFTQTYWVLTGIMSIWLIGAIILIRFNYKLRKKSPDTKKWLLKEIIFGNNIATTSLIFSFQTNSQLIIQNTEHIENLFVLVGISAFSTLFYIVTYITLYYLPLKSEVYLTQTYPEYQSLCTNY
ncbi:hypothetical protein ACILDU_09175 [Capnocytophaga canimorsus]|uniref:hypothetical protein n=1 Tax=Capnocytophaga canimorsus TaxID=28188 RepID=UPI0037D83160